MTEPTDLTQAVFARLATFVRGLSVEDLSALAAGTARLRLVRPDGPAASAGPGLQVEAETVRSTLSSAPDRAEAVRYLDDLRLTTPQLRALAKALGLAVATSMPKAQVRDTIVQWTVGRRVDAGVLSRPTL